MKKKPLDASTVLGCLPMGHRNIEIVLDWQEHGGKFYSAPDSHGPPRMRIGMASNDWGEQVAIAMHEALEMELANMECRFVNCGEMAKSTDGVVFHMNHRQFSEAVARVGHFLANLLPAVEKARNKRAKLETKHRKANK